MIKILPLPKAVLLMAMLLFSLASFGQLPNFTLTLGSTPETCNGNGSITISVAGTDPAATMVYEVYLLPNEVDDVATVNAGPVLNRPAGNYKVVATQSVGALSNTQVGYVTIADNRAPIDYQLVVTNAQCGNDGKITASVSSGTIVSYQIVSPFVGVPQASNVFNNLAAGNYTIKAVSNCGVVQNRVIIVGTTPRHVAIDAIEIVEGQLPSCNTISVGHFYGTITGSQIVYPLTFTFTVFPPGGGTPTVITQTVASGTNAGGTIYANIPFYNGQAYTYNLVVTDACGSNYTRNNNQVNKKFDVTVSKSIVNCVENIFSIEPDFFRAPYTVTFTSAPAGFVPATYSASHPTFSGTANYGGVGNAVPEGNYTISVTDACGRTIIKNFTVEDPDITPTASGDVEGCSPTGTINADIPNRVIAQVIITEGPPGFPVPQDVSSGIGPEGFTKSNMPVGHYELQLTDTCGDVYHVELDMVPVAADPTLAVMNRPGCDGTTGSIRVSLPDPDANFTSFIITNAPAGFPHPLPYNATALTVNNQLFMNSLPVGQYSITTVDNCGVTRSRDLTVETYVMAVNNVIITPYCGSFSIKVEHTSSNMVSAAFFLQRFDPVTNTWGHPLTGVVYPDGTLPNTLNSVFLTNNVTLNNQQYYGDFRVIKVFYTFGNGTTANNRCIQVIDTFTFDGFPEITAAYAFPCANGLTEVVLEAIGVAPLTYRITKKNNQPFVVNNGISNVFSGLEPADYEFEVTDNCGNSDPRPFTINDLAPPVITATGFCEGENSNLATQQFSFLTYQWYEAANPTTILSTSNVLAFPSYNSATDAGTYYVKLTSANANSCMNRILGPFQLQPNDLPDAGADNLNISLCSNSNSINLNSYLAPGHDTGGVWQDMSGTGQLTGNMLNTNGLAAGSYSFKYTVTGDCSLTDDAIVSFNVKQRPQAPAITPAGQTCEGDDVQLNVATVPGATYSWTGPNGFTSIIQSPAITDVTLAANGTYEVTVTVDGCTSPPAQIILNVTAKPVFSITGNDQLCAGQSTTLNILPGNLNQTNIIMGWYQDGGLLPGVLTPSIQVFAPGIYEVEMSSLGCTKRESFTVFEGSIDAEIIIDGGCDNNEEYVLYVVNTADFANATFSWAGPNSFIATGEEAVITGLAAGDYTVTVNMDGCEKTEPITILNTFCKIPKGISPNGDEYNNAFDLSNFDVKKLKIFNRYGMRVYEQENYKDEWHGQSFVGELPTGTYYYVVELSSGKQATGWVYLMREL
jgi:gliding motility-associated-like protein